MRVDAHRHGGDLRKSEPPEPGLAVGPPGARPHPLAGLASSALARSDWRHGAPHFRSSRPPIGHPRDHGRAVGGRRQRNGPSVEHVDVQSAEPQPDRPPNPAGKPHSPSVSGGDPRGLVRVQGRWVRPVRPGHHRLPPDGSGRVSDPAVRGPQHHDATGESDHLGPRMDLVPRPRRGAAPHVQDEILDLPGGTFRPPSTP